MSADGECEYGKLLNDIARCTASGSVGDGIAPRDMLQRLRQVRRQINDFRRRHDELPRDRRACLREAMTTIDHACRELHRLKQMPEVMR